MAKKLRKPTKAEAEAGRAAAVRVLEKARRGKGELPSYIVHDGADVSLTEDGRRVWVTVRMLVTLPAKRRAAPAKEEAA